jgi:hypothetical protein
LAAPPQRHRISIWEALAALHGPTPDAIVLGARAQPQDQEVTKQKPAKWKRPTREQQLAGGDAPNYPGSGDQP